VFDGNHEPERVSVTSERARQKPLETLADRAVALAGCALETVPIGDSNRPSALNDQTGSLERARDAAHGRALHTQHLCQGLMGERYVVLIGSVAGAQDRAAASGFHAVNGIARNALQRLREKSLYVAEQHLADPGTLADRCRQAVERKARGGSRDLGDVTSEGLTSHERAGEAEDRFSAEYSHFDGAAVLEVGDEGHDGIVRKVGMPDGLAGLVNDPAARQLDDLEMWFERQEVFGLQRGEEPVIPVNGRL